MNKNGTGARSPPSICLSRLIKLKTKTIKSKGLNHAYTLCK